MDQNLHPAIQGFHTVHPMHHEAIIKHAVRNIPGADKQLKEFFDRKTKSTGRMKDDRQDYDNNQKFNWN